MLIRELIETQKPPHWIATHSGFDIVDTDHVLTRLAERGIAPSLVNAILKRIGRARREIVSDWGQQHSVSLYDPRTHTHVIVSLNPRSTTERPVVNLRTVFQNPHYKSRSPIVAVRSGDRQ